MKDNQPITVSFRAHDPRSMPRLEVAVSLIVGQLTEGEHISHQGRVQLENYLKPVFEEASFEKLPASRTDKHHFFFGGLEQHTREVLEAAVAQAAMASQSVKIDWVALIVGAVWHDFGKIHEYALSDYARDYSRGTKFLAGDVLRKEEAVNHITSAVARFGQRLGGSGFPDDETFYNILHIIESHHGRREWGATQVPRTAEALIVHQADMLSVAMESGVNLNPRRKQ